MTIRPATPADIPELQRLAEYIWRACYPGIITHAQIDYMLARMYAADIIAAEMSRGVVWSVIEDQDAPVGFLAFEVESDRRAKLHKLYVLPERQGCGLGRSALEWVCREAGQRAATSVWLQVNKANVRAIRAYERAGFHVAKEASFDIGGGFVMDDYLMEMRTGPRLSEVESNATT